MDHIAHRFGEKSELEVPHVLVSGTAFSRSMDAIFDGSKRARTMLFPHTVRSVRKYAFDDAKSLARAILNDGLLKLGRDAFADAGIRKLTLPHTLQEIYFNALSCCDKL